MKSALQIIDPATEDLVTEIPCSDANSIREAALRAREGFDLWRATPMTRRVEVIETFRSKLESNLEDCASTLTRETGKPITQSRSEIRATLDRIDFFLAETPQLIEPQIVKQEENLTETISWDPIGVIANVSAWNFPYFIGTNVFIPAILTGNSVLYKASEYSTMTGRLMARLLHESGVPESVFQLIIGTGDAGSHLIEQPIDALFFTGSMRTGKSIAARLGSRMIPQTYELGGKDPVYVCEDVDAVIAASGTAEGVFYNAGQSCCAVERLYVHQAIYEEFVAAFVEQALNLQVGSPLEESTSLGPLARKDQIQVLLSQVDDARNRGARILAGGHRVDCAGWFFEPTVIVDVDHTMAVMREESFGPIIGIQKVSGDLEAQELMADTEYGLTAGIYTRDTNRARMILATLDSGSAYINCCDRVSAQLPWSGRRGSGMGVTLSRQGITSFLRPRAWHIRSS